MKTALRTLIIIAAVASLFLERGAAAAGAQASDPPKASLEAPNGAAATGPGTPVAIVISGDAPPAVAVVFGESDVTALFERTGNRLVYRAALMPLAVGTTAVKVFAVAETWKEIGRFDLVVTDAQPTPTPEASPESSPTPTSSETSPTPETPPTPTTSETPAKKFNFLPSFAIGMKAQPFQSNFPIDARPAERATFNDFTLTGSLKTTSEAAGFKSETNFDFAGSTFKPEVPQFGVLGREAPDVDLTSYLMNFEIGKAKLSVGHTSFGANRHLVSSFSSRGLSITVPLGKRFDVSAGVLNGTSILGFGNFTGLGKIRHQIQGATLGVEFLPSRKEGLRLEISVFNGYLQALNGVSEGRVVDAERSRGLGLRFLGSDPSGRFKFETGFARSRFFNPQDTTLDPDGNAVPLPAQTRSAHYAEGSVQFLKDLKVTKSKNLNATATAKYEYVEPLFKSIGASASADRFAHEYGIEVALGEITFAAGHARANDNLRNVPSILKSLTRANRWNVALPLAALFGGEKPSKLLPRLGFTYDRAHQFGAGVPVGGGFEIDLSTIPDLVNVNRGFTSSWDLGKFTLEYTYSRSLADNRQPGSETLDQLGWAHGVNVAVNARESLSFSTGLTFETQRDLGLATANRTKSLNLGVNWAPFKGATFTTELSQTLTGDAALTVATRGVNYSSQFAYTISREKSRFDKFGVQAFARFADTYSRNRDFSLPSATLTRTKIVTAGLTFNIF